MNPRSILAVFATLTSAGLAQEPASRDTLVAVERIWDRAESNAFTSLCVAGGRVYCAFREGTNHVGGIDGTVRVIASADRMNWTAVARFEEAKVDLRDPKLTTTPDGRLMLLAGGSRYVERALVDRATRVAFGDARTGAFGALEPIQIDPTASTGDDWLWRVTWHGAIGYGVVYHGAGADRKLLDLVATHDGRSYARIARLEPPMPHESARPNETTLRFLSDETMLALVRCDGGDAPGLLGAASPPYDHFTWTRLDRRIGGPDLVVLDGDRLLVGSRAYPPAPNGPGRSDATPWTTLFWLDRTGETHTVAGLPSGGDCSYPGFAIDGDNLLISYYSSHRGHAAIYLATARLSVLRTR